MERNAWKSKLARRMVRIFVLLVAVPVVVTVLTLGYMQYAQMAGTTRTMNVIHETAIGDAGRSFRQQGGEALRQSATQTQNISMNAIQSMSRTIAKEQERSLRATAHDFSEMTRHDIETAMQQSLATNRGSLAQVGDRMTGLFEQSARTTQQRASGNVEKAMLALTDTLMRERASRLAFTVSDHISDATNFLMLTAQMPGMSDGDAGGQKATLDSLVRRHPQFMSLTVMDSHGRETAMSASDRAVTMADLGSHPGADYFESAVHGHVYIALEKSLSAGTAPTLRMAVPIELYRGKVVGALTARITLEDLWETIRTARIGKKGFAYVVDQTGRVLTPQRRLSGSMLRSSASLEPLGNTVETLPWRVVVAVPRDEAMQPIRTLNRDISDIMHRDVVKMRSQIQASSAQTSQDLQQKARQIQDMTAQRTRSHAAGVFQRLSNTTRQQTQTELIRVQKAIQSQSLRTQTENDHQMEKTAEETSAHLSERVRTLSDRAIQSGKYRVVLLSVVIMLVSCGVGSIVALITAGRIVRPVVRLAQAAHAIAGGDLERRVDEQAPDEIGDLASAFNTMADSLQTSRTDLNEAEGQLVQSAKLASLGTLAAGVAHELNQPVAIIRGLAQQLRDEPELSEDVLADLKIIEGQTGRMTKIIKHLRTFCRTGGGELTDVDVHGTVQDCFLLIGEQLRTHNIEVAFDLCESTPTVLGDVNELEQVFLNLITNARDALEGLPGAKITIASHIRDGRVVVEFRDNGPGIPATVAQRIFDPFFTTKEPGKGTGLGLSISHTIIGKHQGDLRVHNDNGAVFTIVLPLAGSIDVQALKAA
jgi:C4-dicarboxylate-specific signal transduction histidine kinase